MLPHRRRQAVAAENQRNFLPTDHALPAWAVKTSTRPTIICEVDAIRKTVGFRIVLQHFLLIDNAVTITCEVIVTAQSLIKGGDFTVA